MKSNEIVVRPFNPQDLQSEQQLHPVFRRILSARGVVSSEHIDYRLKNMLPLGDIRNLDKAAALLGKLIQQKKTLLVFGDYDADGATSTALCVRALKLMGHANTDFLMPDRFIDGYGLSVSIAEKIIGLKPDCVITVDNGIASNDGIALLRENQIEVLVTDHHLPGDELPEASVIVNQNAWPDCQSGRSLAGVGIAFYLMLALRRWLREAGWFNSGKTEPNLAACLDLVAIGSVADLVPLDYHNRILVNEGLNRIRAGACCEGIKALIDVAGKHLDNFTSSDIAFTVAPRINAAGRLDDITIGVQCLLADTAESAQLLAQELEQINQYRREIQQQMADEASAQMKQLDQAELGRKKSIVLYQPDWHEGIVGIVASKLKEKYHRPAIVFAQAEDGQLKGSGRSIAGIHLRDMLDAVDRQIPGAIIKFGGHAMAAGLTLKAEALTEFKHSFESVMQTLADPASFNPEIEFDGELEGEQFNLNFASELQDLSPWGQRFPVPSFVGEFDVQNQRVLGGKHLKLTLAMYSNDQNSMIDAIAFFQPLARLNQEYERIKLHYELNVNRFRGNDSVQLLIRDILDN